MSAIATPVSRETLEADLIRRIQVFIKRIPESALEKANRFSGADVLHELARAGTEESLSGEARDQLAIARMRKRAFDRLQQRCDLLVSSQVLELLGISKQALSQRAQAGQVLAYTNSSNRRKYYPAFQFENNRVRPVIAKVISDLNVDPEDVETMNFLVQHLASNMDFSDPGEPENLVRRFTLLDDPAGYCIIKRDYENAFEMGK